MARAMFSVVMVVAMAWSELACAEPSSARQTELLHRLKHDCGSCHGMTLKGGLGPPLLPAAIRGKPDEVLAEVILKGLPGTPMPPWDFELTPAEALWLVQRLRVGLHEGL